MNRKQQNWVKIGPSPMEKVVPVHQFSRPTKDQLESAWEMIAPTINKNIDTAPLWKLCAIAYFEGLNHGYFGGKD